MIDSHCNKNVLYDCGWNYYNGILLHIDCIYMYVDFKYSTNWLDWLWITVNVLLLVSSHAFQFILIY